MASIHPINLDSAELKAALRPKRDPRIFSSRYWNSGSAAVAIVAVYGGLARWECLDCSELGGSMEAHLIQDGRLYPKPVCMHRSGENSVVMAGDWGAYIAAIPDTEFQETAENYALHNGTKLPETYARVIFEMDIVGERGRLVYRR